MLKSGQSVVTKYDRLRHKDLGLLVFHAGGFITLIHTLYPVLLTAGPKMFILLFS